MTSLDDLALLNEDNAIRVLVNNQEKFLAKSWLEGEGRAAGSILAKQVLGTDQGFTGTTELNVDEDLVSSFDLLMIWLAIGDSHIKSSLTDENASNLFALASYYGLDQLEQVIQQEQEHREEEAHKVEEEARRAREEQE